MRWLLAAVAALAEAATDTVASEIGQYWAEGPTDHHMGARSGWHGRWHHARRQHRGLGGRRVDCGGRNAGGLIPPKQFWIPVEAGVAGMFIDSLLGATLQRRGWINNQTVNFLATLAAAALRPMLPLGSVVPRP